MTLMMVVMFQMTGSYAKPALEAATCLAFYPQDNEIIAAGADDSSIRMYKTQRFDTSITEVRNFVMPSLCRPGA